MYGKEGTGVPSLIAGVLASTRSTKQGVENASNMLQGDKLSGQVFITFSAPSQAPGLG